MDEKRKKTITITVIGIIFLLIIFVTATYAYFSASSNSEKQQITTAKEELIVTPTSEPIHISNIKPTSDFVVDAGCKDDNINTCPTYEKGINRTNEDVVTIPISVESKSTIEINYNLTIKPENLNLNTENDADNKGLVGGTTEDIKWVLYKLDKENSDFEEPESYGDFYNTEKEQNMLTEISIKPNTTHYYILFIYIEDEDVTQNKLQNITFDVVIGANTKKSPNIAGRKLSEVVLENNIIKNREPNFKPIKYGDGSRFGDLVYYLGLSDKGLFKIKDQNIYYFRGATINNRTVYFGRYKENDNLFQNGKPDLTIQWRILRINADNSITLIFDDFYNSQSFTIENANYEESNIQETLNAWYENTFTTTEKNMIQKTTFCNDRSNSYQGVSDRLNKEIPEPTLDCPEEYKIEAYIGLPTADEMFYAGVYNNIYDVNNKCGPYGCSFNYLNYALTMSPASKNSLYKCSNYYCESSTSGYIYPIITLKPEVTISESVQYNGKTYKSKIGEYNVGYEE